MESTCDASKDKSCYGLNPFGTMFSRKKYKDITYDLLESKTSEFVKITDNVVLNGIGGFFKEWRVWDFENTVEQVAFSKEVKTFADQNKLLADSVAIEILYEVVLIEALTEYQVITGKKIPTKKLLKNFFKTIHKKNADYGSENIIKMGLLGISRLISNKLNRYKNLKGSKNYNFEPLVDTVADIVCYAILGIILCKKFLCTN